MSDTIPVIRVVAGAILREGLLLVGQRPASHRLSLLWEFPGGKVDPGESDVVALRRELREELDVDVQVGSYFGEASYDGHTGRILLLGYVCELVDGEPTALEHEELRWISPDEFDGFAWAPADRALIQDLAAWLGREAKSARPG